MKKETKLVIFFGLLFSFIIGFPNLFMIYKNSYTLYEPLSLKNANPLTLDENLYSSDVQEVMNGNFKLSNSQLANKSYLPSAQVNYFPFYVLGSFGYILGKSIKNLQIISDFIFPFILFILFYIFLGKLNFTKSFRLLITAILMLVGLSPFVIVDLVKSLFSNHIVRPLEFSRFFSPQFTLTMLLISLIFLYISLYKRDIKYFIFTGIFGGLLFYTYFYFATFFWFGVGFMILIYLIKKEYSTVKRLIITSTISIIISIFFVINLLKLKALPYYKELVLRVGEEFPNILSFWHLVFTMIILVALVCILIIPKNKRDCSVIFLTSFLLGSIICINLHIFLGYTVLYLHWWDRIIAPFVIISFAFFLQYLLCNKLSVKLQSFVFRRFIPFLFIICIIAGIFTQLSFSLNTYNNYKTTKEEIGLYDWLNKNTPKDSTILTLSIESNFNLASHTHNNIYNPHSFLTTISTEETIDRFLFTAFVFNLSENDMLKRLKADNLLVAEYDKKVYSMENTSQELFEISFFNYYLFHEEHMYHHYKLEYFPPELPRDYFGYYIPNELKNKIMDKYNSGDFKTYHYDYILVGPYEKNFNYNFEAMKVVFDNNGRYTLYQV